MSPAEELLAAANKLRKWGARATPGPWEIRDGNDVSTNVATRDERMVIDGGGWTDGKKAVVYGAALVADATWIALMSPDRAEPLAAWLEDAGGHAATAVAPHNQEIIADPNALAFARKILGSTS